MREDFRRLAASLGRAAGGAACASVVGLALPALAAAAPSNVYSPAAAGTAVRAAAPSLAPATLAAALPTPQTPISRGARRVGHAQSTLDPTAPPATQSVPVAGGASTSLPANFNGVSSLDSAVTNFGQEFEPPDQGLCVGNGFVVEMVNSAYTVYRPDGTVVAGPFNINGPFAEPLLEFTSDPRCYYEAATHTWYATIVVLNPTFTASTLDVAVNTSGDPTTPWTTYKIDTSGMGGRSGPKHRECPCFADQPRVGIDAHNLYVTGDDFSILGASFYGGEIFAIAKKDLLGLVAKPRFVLFANLRIAGTEPIAPQPATTVGAAPAEYFLGSIDSEEISGRQLAVWALSNGAAVVTGGRPTLSSIAIESEPYAVPLLAEQKGSSSLIEAGDDRMQQTEFVGGRIWGELDTGVAVRGDTADRAGAAFFDVRPTLKEGVLSAARIDVQGYVAVRGNYLLYPALQVSGAGEAVMVGTLSGSSRYPSAAYTVLAPGASAFGPVTVAGRGTGPYDPNAERWGDYSYAALDPSGTSVWLATEYVPPKSSQTTDGERNWGTRVLDVPLAGG